MSKHSHVLCLLVACTLASSATAVPPPCSLPCAAQVGEGIPLGTGDMNGDGRPDLVTLVRIGAPDATFEIWFGTAGGFDTAPAVEIEAGFSTELAFDAAVADLNGDLADDLAVVVREGVGLAAVVFGGASWPATGVIGSLPGRELIITGIPRISGAGLTGSARLATGDFNADGQADLGIGLGRASTLFGGPPDRVDVLFGPLAPGSRDLDVMPPDLRVLLPEFALWVGGQAGRGLVLADVDADGAADLVMGTTGVVASATGDGVAVVRGGPGVTGTVDLRVVAPDLALTSGASLGLGLSARVEDVDADGVLDLLLGTTLATPTSPAGDVAVTFGPLAAGVTDIDLLAPAQKLLLRGVDARLAPAVLADVLPAPGPELYLRTFVDPRTWPAFAVAAVAIEPVPPRGADIDVDASTACSLIDSPLLSADFTGDGRLDLVTYLATTGEWQLLAQGSAGGGSSAPVLTITSRPTELWAPSHRLAALRLGSDVRVTVVDDCDPTPVVAFSGATCDEPADDRGDGRTSPDVVVTDEVVWLRVERDGRGDGRTCTVTVTASDSAGNSTSESFDVLIAHDRREGPARTPGARPRPPRGRP